MSTAMAVARHTGGFAWDFTRWSVRHWFGLAIGLTLVPVLWVVVQRPDYAVLFVLVWWVVPALVCTAWRRFWPRSWWRRVGGPLQRRGWRTWARSNWGDVSKKCGLSTSYEASVKNWWNGTTSAQTRWQPPTLRSVKTSKYGVDLTVSTRRGQTSRDITAQAQAIGAAAGAITSTGHVVSPSRAVISLVMVDHLGVTITSAEPVAGVLAPVEVGRYASGQPVFWDPTRCLSTAIQGQARSGKSALCYGYLSALAFRPDVLVCGVDKTGVLLWPLAKGRGASWTVTSAQDGPKVVATLNAIVDYMNDRIENLLATGRDKLTEFDAGTPVVLVVMEEYPGLIKELKKQDNAEGRAVKDRIAPKVEAAVGVIAAEGAKAGVLALVLAQRMSSESIDTDTRANLPIHVTLRVDKSEAVRMLHDGVETTGIEEVRQFPPGRALYEAPGVLLQQFQAHNTDYDTYVARVARGMASLIGVRGFKPAPVIVPKPEEEPPKGRKAS